MAIDFDGSTSMLVNCSSGASLANFSSMTIACWINMDTLSSLAEWICTKNSATTTKKSFFLSSDAGGAALQFAAGWDSSAGQWRCVAPSKSQWHHVAVTYNHGSSTADPIFYIDGAAVSSTEIGTPAGAAVVDAADALRVGFSGITASVHGFDGRIEDLRYLNRILSAAEVATLAAGYRGPLGGEALWLPMDDFSEPFYSSGALSSVTGAAKSRIYDRSGNGNHGLSNQGQSIQVVTAAPWTNPNGSTTTDFSIFGTSGAINVSSAASINNIFGAGGTIVCWVKIADETQSNAIVSKGAYNAGTGWVFGFDNALAGNPCPLTLRYGRATTDGVWTSSAVLSTGTWAHVGVTYDASSTSNYPTFYFNSSALTTSTDAAPVGAADNDSAQQMEIFSDAAGIYAKLNGGIEDFRAYARVLSAGEIAALAGGSRAKLGGEVVWLSASHRQGVGQFDAIPLNADNVVPDLSGNGNHGTPSGRPTGAASIAPRMSGWIPQ